MSDIEEKYDITCVYIYKDKVVIVDKNVGKFPDLPWKKATSSKKAVRKVIDRLLDMIRPVRQEEINEIIGYYNERLDQNLNPETKKYASLIQALFRRGYNVEDFKKVIDNMIEEWLGDEKMAGKLQPTTLFSESRFDQYLNRVKYRDPEKLQSKPTYNLDAVMEEAMQIRDIF